MESPRSETQTRYSTPVSDLDDHRDQSGIPALNMPVQALPASRGAGTSANAPEPEFLQVNGPVSRDFEHAITDDEKSKIEDFLVAEHPYGNLTPRRTNSQRLHYSADGITNSRDRSRSSSRSVSPPNSVDAFAQPRRRERANTFGSRAPSDLDGDLHRTVSGGTHRRRPTFTNGSIRQVELNEETNRPEEDVCFPDFDGPTKTFLIDFEELEEFVAESRRGRPNLGQTRQRQSFSSNGVTPKPFLTNSRLSGYIPQITKQEASPLGRKASDCAVDDSPIDIEKSTVPFASKPTRERGLSTVEPTRFSFFSSEIEHTIHAPEFGDLLMPGECFRELFRLPDDGGAWWLDVMNPTTDELEMFQKGFGIHRLTAEDIERQEIREKVELFNQYYFVCFRSFNQTDKESEDYMKPLNVYMVVFREGILTFTYAPSPHAAHVRKRIGNLRNYINLTADWICYAMVDNIVDCFEPVIRSIAVETDQIDDQVFVARDDDFSPLLRQIGECRKKVMSLMRLLGGKADVIKGFAKRCNEQYSVTPRGEIGLYLGDIQDHVVTMMSNLGHSEKMLSRSHSNHLAQLSVDHMRQGNHTNNVLSKITLLASVLVPLNLICGIFGMNVPVPGSGRDAEGFTWFFSIVGVIAGIVIVCLITAKRFKLI